MSGIDLGGLPGGGIGPAGESRLRRTLSWQAPLTAGHQVCPGLHREAWSLAFLGMAPQHSTQACPDHCVTQSSCTQLSTWTQGSVSSLSGPLWVLSNLRKAWDRAALSGLCLVDTEGYRPMAELWVSESHVATCYWSHGSRTEYPCESPRPGHRRCRRRSQVLSPRGCGIHGRPQRGQGLPGL